MIDGIFYRCVALLEWLAEKFNTSYETVNVILFVIIMPVVFLLMLAALIIK